MEIVAEEMFTDSAGASIFRGKCLDVEVLVLVPESITDLIQITVDLEKRAEEVKDETCSD